MKLFAAILSLMFTVSTAWSEEFECNILENNPTVTLAQAGYYYSEIISAPSAFGGGVPTCQIAISMADLCGAYLKDNFKHLIKPEDKSQPSVGQVQLAMKSAAVKKCLDISKEKGGDIDKKAASKIRAECTKDNVLSDICAYDKLKNLF